MRLNSNTSLLGKNYLIPQLHDDAQDVASKLCCLLKPDMHSVLQWTPKQSSLIVL